MAIIGKERASRGPAQGFMVIWQEGIGGKARGQIFPQNYYNCQEVKTIVSTLKESTKYTIPRLG